MKNFLSVFLLFFLLISCTSVKNIEYLQNPNQLSNSNTFEPTFQVDDQLLILVSSENPEIAAPYNLKSYIYQANSESSLAQERNHAYILDSKGNIEFPVLGTINLLGQTRTQATNKIKDLLKEHIKDPIVNIRLLNFKISVLGEVNKPGVYSITSDRITILEALALAGDLSIYGKRNTILLVREKDGVKTYNKIDITQAELLNSPNYYLSQNDVIYVTPNKTKVNSSVIGPNIVVGLSALSLAVTILALTIK